MHRWFLIVLLVGLSLPGWVSAKPEIALKDVDGRERPAAEYLGKGTWTVVVVWSVDCPICRRDIHQMAFLHDDHRKKGDLQVLGFSIDGDGDRQRAKAFVAEHGLNFVNWLGDWQDVERMTGVPFRGTPTYYVFAPNGEYAGQRIGAATQEDIEALVAQLKSRTRKP